MYYTRLAYNKEDWKKPSGSDRKSLNFKTFERKYNFAFEEWLFDNSMLIDYKKYAKNWAKVISEYENRGKSIREQD